MRRAALSILVLRLVGAALTYLFVVSMSRLMTVADFGVLGTVMSASQFLSVLGSFGQQLAIIRFVPPLLARNQPGAAHDLIGRAAKVVLFGNGLQWLIIAAGILLAEKLGRLDRGMVIAFGMLMMPLTAVIDLQANLARSYKLILLAIVPKDVLWRVFSLAAAVVLVLATGSGSVSLMACFEIMIVMLAVLIVGAQLIAQFNHGLPSIRQLRAGTPEAAVVAQWRAARTPLWLVSVSAIALGNVDVIITALLLGPEAAGIYFAANRIALAPIYFQQSYNIVIGPLLSERHANGDRDGAAAAARTAGLHIFVPTLAAAVGLAAASNLVLGLFGPEFHRAFPVLCVLLAASVANTAFGPVDMVLNMCGKERLSMRLGVAALLGGTALMALFGALWGAMGIAVGVLVTNTVRRLSYWIAADRSLGMRLDVISALLAMAGHRTKVF